MCPGREPWQPAPRAHGLSLSAAMPRRIAAEILLPGAYHLEWFISKETKTCVIKIGAMKEMNRVCGREWGGWWGGGGEGVLEDPSEKVIRKVFLEKSYM